MTALVMISSRPENMFRIEAPRNADAIDPSGGSHV